MLDHNKPGLSAEEKSEIRRSHLTCNVFRTGTNAVRWMDSLSMSMA